MRRIGPRRAHAFTGGRSRHAASTLACLVATVALAADGSGLTLTGSAMLRPQNAERTFGGATRAILLDDDSLRVTVSGTAAELDSFTTVVLQARDVRTTRWRDVHTFFTRSAATSPVTSRIQPVASTTDPRIALASGAGTGGTVLPSPDQEQPRPAPTVPTSTAGGSDPNRDLKLGGVLPARTTIPATVSHRSPRFALAAGTHELRAVARRANGSSLSSPRLTVEARRAPAVLTLLAMGGTCTDPDANTSFTTLADAMITRDTDVCSRTGLSGTYLAALTPMASVNCNNPCNTGCTNFMEHLALRIMSTEGLADQFDSIDNPGDAFCHRRANGSGVRNRIVFGKWRNTEEELVCGTPVTFDDLIDEFRSAGGAALILIGQSQGGAKLAGMVRDHWRWGDLPLELIALWDATSFDVPSGFDTGHLGVVSMGVRRVGPRPKRVLSFFQYSNPVPFQNGAPLDPAEPHASAEQHDFDGCLSHNGIARSQFVHVRTTEVVKAAIRSVRDRART